MFRCMSTRGSCPPLVLKFAGVLVVSGILTLMSAGCGESAGDEGVDPLLRSTLGETVIDGLDPEGNDDPTVASSDIENYAEVLSFTATRAACCSPLALEFAVDPSEPTYPAEAFFEWDFGDGGTSTGQATKHTFLFPGNYVVVLTARFPDSVTIEAEQTVSVGSTDGSGPVSEDSGVIADAGLDQEANPGEMVLLEGSGSGGTSSSPLTFQWSQVLGPTVELSNLSSSACSFIAPADPNGSCVLVFELIVIHENGYDADRVQVTVSPSTTVGQVQSDAGRDQTVEGGEMVVLNGAGQTGSGSEPLVFAWEQTFGPDVVLTTPNSATTAFTAPLIEVDSVSLTFSLTVTQGDASDTDHVIVTVLATASDPPDPAPVILAMLQELPPLPKVHYSWPVPRDMLLNGDPLLDEYVRITHSLGFRGEWWGAAEMDAAVALCQRVNDADPAVAATIAVNYSPWHRRWTEELPPTYMGPEHYEEIALFEQSMGDIQGWLADANASYGADIEIPVLLFDSERFEIREEGEPDHEEWNAAINAKYDVFYSAGKTVFPNVAIEWFGRGASRIRFTLEELGDGFSTWLFEVPYQDYTRAKMRNVHQKAQEYGVTDIMPWVALASGHPRVDGEAQPFDYDWNYDLGLSWQIGAEINDPYYGDHPEDYAPWHAATAVAFYPGPFDDRSENWATHFIAYVRGAHGIEDLP